ncbi:tyrosine-type recombinase/integrase [Flagellimonas sp.]|uniref:tyrosine-type recombinase/integrase n=1 Tax=Flagellimonas sp. TaxID=2058762 RepID=UPI003B52F08F
MKNQTKIPDRISITSVADNLSYDVLTGTDSWELFYGGSSYLLQWESYNFHDELEKILKLFIIHRIYNKSIITVINGDFRFIKHLDQANLTFPFLVTEIFGFFQKTNSHVTVSVFKTFYSWCCDKSFSGFIRRILLEIKEFKNKQRDPYSSVFLSQEYISETEMATIYERIIALNHFNTYEQLRNNIILSLAYELGPRRSQFYPLNVGDFIVHSSVADKVKYYSLNLPMSKKRKSLTIEKRLRSLSKSLGQKIERLISFHNEYIEFGDPLFVDTSGERLKAQMYTDIVKRELKTIGIRASLTDFRHHLAQTLANQGASAEVIAEIIGHNSTIPARAYITATPRIADIKSEALGKSKRYQEIMQMMNTGEIVDKNTISKERWVKGIVGNQYIGGIGSCGLPSNTVCPKNPVYACYTCIKFHPFVDGRHVEVKESLQKQVQYHIDVSEAGNDIEHNRPILQLEKTIGAVKKVIEKIKEENGCKPTT